MGLFEIAEFEGIGAFRSMNPPSISGERSLTPEKIVDLFCDLSVRARVSDNRTEGTEASGLYQVGSFQNGTGQPIGVD